MLRLLICAGGTGGGIYPAIAVLEALNQNEIEVLWVGSQNGLDANLVRNALPVAYREIPAAGLHGVGISDLPRNIFRLIKGFIASREILKSFRPDVIFFTGGYLAVPMTIAGRSYAKVVFVPDVEPGLALKVISKFAAKIALSIPASKQYFSNQRKIVVTGYPTRARFANIEIEEALRVFRISSQRPTLLVFGGSRGARSINHAILAIIPELVNFAQIIHISGELDWPMVSSYYEGLAPSARQNYFPYPYLHENMPHAMCAADLVVSRAGASTMGEYPMLGLPAILVPYPHAWKYQKQNADYMVEHGAAVLLQDDSLTETLLDTLKDFLLNPDKLAQMKINMLSLAHPQAAADIAQLILDCKKEKEAGQ